MSLLQLPVSEVDHRSGPEDAPVTLVEYGDFECPYCGRAYPIVEKIRRLMGPRLRFVFRHFPLTSIHPHAERAAETAEAAADQGRFWEMHDALFENQQSLEDADLVARARALDLDAARVHRELAAGLHAERVRHDFLSGVRSGVNGTPTFFINGVRHDASWDLETLLAALEVAEQSAAAPIEGRDR
jgi:protein-disulfide isomerase